MTLSENSIKCLKGLIKKLHIIHHHEYDKIVSKIVDIMKNTHRIDNIPINTEHLDSNILKQIFKTNKLINVEYRDLFNLVTLNNFMPYKDAIYKHEYKSNYENNIANVTIYHDNMHNIQNVYNEIFFIIEVFQKIFNKTNKVKLNIIYTDYKKEISDDLDAKNINSGSCISGKVIHIWRQEELIKVLIHELGHFYEIDKFTTDVNSELIRLFNSECNYKLQETFVEMIAVIVNICYVIYSFKYVNIMANFWSMMNYEYTFTNIQVSKLLNIYQKLDPCIMNKKTAIFSYYVLKLYVMHSLIAFDIYRPESTLDAIAKSLHNNFTQDVIAKSLHNNFVINHIYDGNNDFIQHTMRMTCIELIK